MYREKEIIRKTFQLMRIMHKNKNHERLRRDWICVGLHFIFTYMLVLESQSEPLQQQQVQWETETIQWQFHALLISPRPFDTMCASDGHS